MDLTVRNPTLSLDESLHTEGRLLGGNRMYSRNKQIKANTIYEQCAIAADGCRVVDCAI